MPSEPLPIDRKDLFKDRKPSSSEPVEIVQARWRESPTTPSSHPNSHGSSSSGWGGGPSHFRRSFTDVHTKPVGGGWHTTSAESGPRMSLDLGGQKDRKGGNFWETTASPNGNSHPPDFVNSWDQRQLNDQHAKINGDGVITTGGPRLVKEISLGSSLDWKPLKWIRSGSLSSRGSGFSHSSSCKIVGVESFDAKMDTQPGNVTLLPSLSGDVATCVTPKTPDEASSRKKPRLGWGEGLAKYEKKKVDPDDIVDKENGVRYGTVDSSEPLLPSPNLPGKSPTLTGFSESASPTTSCSFACSLSPGLEEKTSMKATTVDNDNRNPSVASCCMFQNQSQGLTFNLENLDLTEGLNLSTSLDELMQTDVTSAPGSRFAMNKLQVWKADISRTLEITESEIDSLEHDLKSLISDGGSCSYSPASSFLKECNNKNTENLSHISSVDMLIEKTDGFLEEHSTVKDLSRESPCTASFKLVGPHSDTIEQNDSRVNLDTRSEKAECSQDHVCGNGSQVPIGSSSTVSDGSAVYYRTEDKLYDSILASNKVIANRSSNEFSKILPTTDLCTSISRATDVSLIKKKIATRKRFLKFKERVITLKFRTFQYSWKEDLRLLSVRRVGGKSQKKLDSSSRMGYNDHLKHRTSIHFRLSFPAGSLSLVPTTEVVEYAKKLLLDSRVRTYRNVLKMPVFILDKRQRMSTRFISDNGLVENPVDVEKERSIVNPWTAEDKEIFLNKYALFGKDFRKIASFFQHKSVADCVEFYYKNHKSEEFQKTKKNSKFAKEKSCNTNTNTTYLVTSGKRMNREMGATSLDMLGAASVMVANVDGSILERSNDIAKYCNEQETAAADVLAGICGGSISSDALGSCITSSVDHGDVHHDKVRRCQKLSGSSKRHEGSSSLNDVDEETCSDDSCGEEIDSSIWTEEEKSSFIKAVKSYGKDFSKVSRCVGTRSVGQCSLFFSKTKKCFGLDVIDLGAGSEGTTGANQGGGGSDQDDACMVDSGSGISNDKSSVECKMEVEDLHSSDYREEHAESGRNNCREPELVLENLVRNDREAEIKPGDRRRSSSNGDLEGAADSEVAASLEESLQNTCSDSASGEGEEEEAAAAKFCREEELRESEHQLPSSSSRGGVNVSIVRGPTAAEDLNSVSYYSRLDLNAASDNNQEGGNCLTMSNLFPHGYKRKSVSQDDVSSRLSFRKSGQRSSSIIDGYHLNLSKLSPSRSEPHTNMKLDESLLMPRDGCIQMCYDLTSDDASVSQQQQRRRSSSLDEPTSKGGDLKLFGQIITNPSSNKLQQQPLPKANISVQETEKPKPDGGKVSSNLKFDHHRKVASLDFDQQSKEYAFGMESNLQLKRSYGFWDGSRIQTGFSSLPDSAVLLAKYPAAFSGSVPSTTFSKLNSSSLESGNVVSGFQIRKPTNGNRTPSYHAYGQSFTVDKLLPEMPKREELEGSRGGMNVVGGACNGGVSDPVAAIRMHYAKTEQFKNGGPEAWRSNVSSDIGSR